MGYFFYIFMMKVDIFIKIIFLKIWNKFFVKVLFYFEWFFFFREMLFGRGLEDKMNKYF